MELELYKHIHRHFLNDAIDLFDRSTQEKIEDYDSSKVLDKKILDTVKKHLKSYNRYLESHSLKKVMLRYYQILALYFTQVFFHAKR